MSPVAYALFTHLQGLAPGSNIVLEELVRVCRSSKTAIRAAFEELAAEGLISYTQEG
jgi:DNA-binding GntR family transcriptional regulator